MSCVSSSNLRCKPKNRIKIKIDSTIDSLDDLHISTYHDKLYHIKDVIYFTSSAHNDPYIVYVRKNKNNATYEECQILSHSWLKEKLKKASIPFAQLYTLAESNEKNYYTYIIKDYVSNIRELVNKYILIDIMDGINIIKTDVLINNHNNSFYKEMNKIESTI
jgi:hypothetical protein